MKHKHNIFSESEHDYEPIMSHKKHEKVKMPKTKMMKAPKPSKPKPVKIAKSRGKDKVEKVMKEFSEKKLHSSSKKGPLVTNRKQAIAISLSEARAAGAKIPKKKK